MEPRVAGMKDGGDGAKLAPRFWRREAGEDVSKGADVEGPQAVSSSRALRFYPPLLTVSTLMSGVFCYLYVTKPVHVTQTVLEPAPLRVEALAGVEGQPDSAPTEYTLRQQAGTRSLVLDPEQGGLPGESFSAAQAEAEVLPGQEVQPLVVPRSRKVLFRPMSEDELKEVLTTNETTETVEAPAPELGGPESSEPLPEDEGSVEHSEGALAEYSEADVAEEGEMEAAAEDSTLRIERIGPEENNPKRSSDHLRVAISLMGELVSDQDEAEVALADSKDE